MPFSQNDLVKVTREIEVTPGVVVGSNRTRVFGTAPTYTPGGETIKSEINTGDAGIKCVRAGLRFADSEIPSELVYKLNHEEMEDVLRDTFPGSEAIAAVSASWLQVGTHIDTTAGPTIVATTPGDFTPLIGMEGAMLETTDPAASGVDPANLRPRVIKAVDSDQIDIEPLYTTGLVGQISEPIIPEGPFVATFNCGLLIRNRGILNARSINFEFEFTDQQTPDSFVMARGQYGATINVAFDGKGVVTIGFGYVGMDYDDITEVTQGTLPVTANPGAANCIFTSAEDLSFFLFNGITQLAADSLTTFNLDGDGTASGVDETSGTRERTGVTVGDLDFTGSFTLLHEHDKMKIVMAAGRAGTILPIDWKFVDIVGNAYWMRVPEAIIEPGGPTPGAKGSKVEGDFTFMSQLGKNGIRTFIIQAFAAP